MAVSIAQNLRRLLSAQRLSVAALAERSGLDPRTIRRLLRDAQRPHEQTVQQLAAALGVEADELFLAPEQLRYRRFDRQTNPLVEEAIKLRPALFADWTDAEFAELSSRFGAGGALTLDGALRAAEQMNRKRELHHKLDLLLESSHAALIGRIVDAMHDEVAEDGGQE